MKRYFVLLALIIVWLLTGCRTADGTGQQQSASMPETMPEDFAFSVQFGYGSRNEINTFNHTVTKDLIVNGTASAPLTFTPDEIAQIYADMRKMNIVGEKVLKPEKVNCSVTPHSEDKWKVRINGQITYLHWSGEYCNVTEDARQLERLRDDIFALVKNKAAYKELPEPVGGYA
ncbi:hypothetical protein [Paenibacillus beijingensis]|uniref:Lipoprotein n=1 Tax=Paenibacillus beijingensis TaxID=1126833 RepID=A0A0D5NJW3_9BACL|nr:hypothetical protein [Paenibacillus beijingensis]AJY75629.1 hypothetical protein VN24_15015 [Paenibacillus beijingensis]